MALHEHQLPIKGKSDVWLTPKTLLEPLGQFDLDPCAAPRPQPWLAAAINWTAEDNGLDKPWFGRVWLNPPFSQKKEFFQKMVEHGNGIALIPAATDTVFFREYVFQKADGILFLYGRPTFYLPDGTKGKSNCGGAICLVAYGKENGRVLERLPDLGRFVR